MFWEKKTEAQDWEKEAEFRTKNAAALMRCADQAKQDGDATHADKCRERAQEESDLAKQARRLAREYRCGIYQNGI